VHRALGDIIEADYCLVTAGDDAQIAEAQHDAERAKVVVADNRSRSVGFVLEELADRGRPPSRVGRQLMIGPTGNPNLGRTARKASVRSRAGDTRRAPPTKAMRLCPSRIKCSAASVMPSRKSALT
jgi:hypothetical protein